jgi:RsiW-degrading membrane proteinase PrsW (M82 family)
MHYGLVLISCLLGILGIRFLQKFDIHKKEPLGTMCLVTVLGGGFSVAIAIALYDVAPILGVGELQNSLGALLVIGPVEEPAKLLAMLCCLRFVRKELLEPIDGLMYMACVALGFSLIENYMYVTRSPGAAPLLLQRLLICTPAQVCL